MNGLLFSPQRFSQAGATNAQLLTSNQPVGQQPLTVGGTGAAGGTGAVQQTVPQQRGSTQLGPQAEAVFRAFNDGIDNDGNANQGKMIEVLAKESGVELKDLSQVQKDTIQNMNIYVGYFADFLVGGRTRDPKLMMEAVQSGLNSGLPGDTLAKVATVYKNKNQNYNNGNIKKLLDTPENKDLIGPGVGDEDVESVNALVRALNRGTLDMKTDVFNKDAAGNPDPNNLIDNDDEYRDSIAYVQSGRFNQEVTDYMNGNFTNINNGQRQFEADREAMQKDLGISKTEARKRMSVPPGTPAAGIPTGVQATGTGGQPVAGLTAAQPPATPQAQLNIFDMITQYAAQQSVGQPNPISSTPLLSTGSAFPTATPPLQLGTQNALAGSGQGGGIACTLAKMMGITDPAMLQICAMFDSILTPQPQVQVANTGGLFGGPAGNAASQLFAAPSSAGSAFGGSGLLPQVAGTVTPQVAGTPQLAIVGTDY